MSIKCADHTLEELERCHLCFCKLTDELLKYSEDLEIGVVSVLKKRFDTVEDSQGSKIKAVLHLMCVVSDHNVRSERSLQGFVTNPCTSL